MYRCPASLQLLATNGPLLLSSCSCVTFSEVILRALNQENHNNTNFQPSTLMVIRNIILYFRIISYYMLTIIYQKQLQDIYVNGIFPSSVSDVSCTASTTGLQITKTNEKYPFYGWSHSEVCLTQGLFTQLNQYDVFQVTAADSLVNIFMFLCSSKLVTVNDKAKVGSLMKNLLNRGRWRNALTLALLLSQSSEESEIRDMCLSHPGIELAVLSDKKSSSVDMSLHAKKYIEEVIGLQGLSF